MPSKKLISLLNEFSKTELNRLRKFLSSPYFNDQEDVLRLFEWLNSQLRKGVLEADQKTKQQVWKNLYGNAPLDDAHIRRLSSDLNLLALQFMVAEARQKNEVAEALELQKVLEKPAYKAHLNSVERQLQKQLEATTAPSAETYLAGFQLHWTIFNRASTVLSTTNYIDKLLPADHYLERFYVVQKLKMYIAWLSFRNFRATEEAFLLPPGFWEYIWYDKNNTLLQQGFSNRYIAKKLDTYFVDASDSMKCYQTRSEFAVNMLGVNKTQTITQIVLYPNPCEAGRVFVVESESRIKAIFDSLGRKVRAEINYKSEKSEVKIDNSGVYIINMEDGNNVRVILY
jgi:hypothetical protein